MAYLFTGKVNWREERLVTTTQCDVFQEMPNSPPRHVAYLKTVDQYGEVLDTTISYNGGSLSNREVIDLPLPDPYEIRFEAGDAQERVALRKCRDWNRKKINYHLVYGPHLCPVWVEGKGDTQRITVYQSDAAVREEGLLYPLLAEIRRTKTFEKGYEYQVRVRESYGMPFLIAVVMLPLILMD